MATALEPIQTPLDMASLKDRYLSLSTAERLTELEVLYQKGMENALRHAALVWSAKERGDDMAPYTRALGDMVEVFYRIGEGSLTVNALRMWGKRLRYLDVIKKLTPPDQEKLCQGPIPVVEKAPDGTFTHRQMQLDDIVESGLPSQVFDNGMIRSVPEQEVYLKRQARKQKPEKAPETISGYRMDYDDPCAMIGNKRIPLAVLEEMVRVLKRFGYK